MTMKKLMLLMLSGILFLAMPLVADTEEVNGYTWTFQVTNDTVEIFKGNLTAAISPLPTGAVTIPSILGGKPVTSIGDGAFNQCNSLMQVTIPDSVTRIGTAAFSGCSSLTSVSIPQCICSSRTSDIFPNVAAITNVIIADGVTYIGDSAFRGCSGLTSVTIPDTVANIGWGAFYGCSGLTYVTIPDSVTSINDYAFYGCSSLTNVLIPNGVKRITFFSFGCCDNLSNLTISKNVTEIESAAFYGCSSLTSVTIPGSVTKISGEAFDACSSLHTFVVAETNQSFSVRNNLLCNKNGTTIVCCPGGLTSVTIPDTVTSIGPCAFKSCRNLTNVTIPNNVTGIEEGAFEYCRMVSVTIPDSVKSIENYTFYECRNLASVAMPNSVTNIGMWAFGFCNTMTSVTIPAGVTSIGKWAFTYCNNLTNVIFGGDAPTIDGGSSFSNMNSSCIGYVRRDSTRWGVAIPGTWNGLNIQYLTPEVEISAANVMGTGTVEVDGELSEVEVASGVTLVVKGENLDVAALAAKITPKPHEEGQSASLFRVKAEAVVGGVSLAVVLDEDVVDPDETAAEIVDAETVTVFGAAADGATVSVPLASAKQGLYYGIVAAGNLDGLNEAAANTPLVRAGEDGVTIPVVKPAGGTAFFKVIVSDRAR